MIKALSPYYFSTPWLSPLTGLLATSYTINLYVWSGDKLTIPTSPQYSLTKQNISQSVGTDKLNVSRLVNDFIDFTPQLTLGLQNTSNQRWVHKEIIYTTSSGTDTGVKQRPETVLMTKGYTYGMEGENAQPPANYVFLNTLEFNMDRTGILSIPLEMGLGTNITVQSFPSNEINDTFTTSTVDTDQSSQAVKLLNVDLSGTTSDKYIIVSYNSVDIYVTIKDELKYEPYEIYFMNKEGEQQSLSFFKERTDSMSVKKQTYENDSAQPNTGRHQYVDLNVQARSKFTLSSGFVREVQNQAFKELSLSTRVYVYEDGFLTPVNVATKEVVYKTRVNERLINYVFNFEYSYNEINNI